MRRESKSILITCPRVSERTGLEVYVTDIARELVNRNWKVTIYAPTLGPHAHNMSSTGIIFASRIEDIEKPDLIHGNFYFETILACLRFPSAPLVYQCHSATIWQALPPKIPNLSKILSVSAACTEVLVNNAGFSLDQISRTFNFVDTTIYQPRESLPQRPAKALIFSNYADETNYVPAVRTACERFGIMLDVVGMASGSPCTNPEQILRSYDIVFARGRAAIEAMAVGCAVILCDHEGVGPMVVPENIASLKNWNFGFRVLTQPHDPAYLQQQIELYDRSKAKAVQDYVRQELSLCDAVDVLEKHYDALIQGHNFPDESTNIKYSYDDLLEDVRRVMEPEVTKAENFEKYAPLYRMYSLGLYLLEAEVRRLGSTNLAESRVEAEPAGRTHSHGLRNFWMRWKR